MKKLLVCLTFLPISFCLSSTNVTARVKPDTTRLAVILAGAVSLGAFEAGAVVELIEALEHYNATHPEHKYVIDVLAGASAGSLNLALLAHEMFFPNNQANIDSGNVFRRVWVEEIDIKVLLPENRENIREDPYFFSRAAIEEIAERYLTGEPSGKPLSMAPDSLLMIMTLTNLNGNKQTIEFQNESIDIHFYDEVRRVKLSEGGSSATALDGSFKPIKSIKWQDVRETAIASGAFPFAFAPKGLADLRDSTKIVNYVDGGLFNNEPLSLAINAARYVDASVMDTVYNRLASPKYERKFVLITPSAPDESQIENISLDRLTKVFPRIVTMLISTAKSLDYRLHIQNVKDNKENVKATLQDVYNLRNESIGKIEKILRAIQLFTKAGIQSGNLKLLRALVNEYPRLVEAIRLEYHPKLKELLAERLFSGDSSQIDWIANNSTHGSFKQLYVDLFNIRGHIESDKFILISNEDTKLAGRKYVFFGGFLNKRLRESDYQSGRYFAHRTLEKYFGPPPVHDHSLGARGDVITLKDHVTKEDRPSLRKRLDERLLAYTSYFDIPGPNLLTYAPVLELADLYLDHHLYRTPKSIYFSWHVNSDRARSFNLGLRLSPQNFFRKEFAQPRGAGWIWWFLYSESHFVFDAGYTDFLKNSFPWIKPYYYNFGWRLNLYIPDNLTLRLLQLQPEMGANLTTQAFTDDLNFTNTWGSYLALTLRAAIIDVKLLFLYDGFLKRRASTRINFGLSFALFDQLLKKRL